MPHAAPDLAARFARRRATPHLVRLDRALARLKSTVTVFHTGAHPDDEQNAMLAFMRFGLGMRTIIGCSTRGEGGQNALGPERGGALGVLRTRELECAAEVIDADIVWLGHGPDDPVHDFGFSKNAPDTLARWGHERIVERLVRAYRDERPDIVIPTFLDVPGQHGHHRAMTEAAQEAIGLAADPDAFPTHFAQGLSPWQVGKFYLPAWSGGGDTYDDEVPPPPETVRITIPDTDGATGVAFDEIGEWSRVFHGSQGMGRWPGEPQTVWPLHLVGASAPETAITDGLPSALADIAPALSGADDALAEALAAFPHAARIIAALARAARIIADAGAACPPGHRHRLTRMLADIEHAMVVASGIDVAGWLDHPLLAQGETTTLTLHLANAPAGTTLTPQASEGIVLAPAEVAPGQTRYGVSATRAAAPTAPFLPVFRAGKGTGDLSLRLETTIAGRSIQSAFGLDTPLTVVPAQSLTLAPDAVLVPGGILPPTPIATEIAGEKGALSLSAPESVTVTQSAEGFVLESAGLPPGRHTLALAINDRPAFARTTIAYPHIGQSVYLAPARLDLLSLDLALPGETNIAYVGGGADNVSTWLARMGFSVTALDARGLAEDLSGFGAIVVGIFAFGLRPDLAAAAPALHRYVEAGGNLVTLYHRPWDGWAPDTVPPRFIKIGQPSLRWRVTDPAAPVKIRAPDHELLIGPNRIEEADFNGWNKERGLYFASEWDPAYVPLIAMSDKGEALLEGSLLSARIGRGRHTHTSLVLHHQLDHLVPGAFRLLANLVGGGR